MKFKIFFFLLFLAAPLSADILAEWVQQEHNSVKSRVVMCEGWAAGVARTMRSAAKEFKISPDYFYGKISWESDRFINWFETLSVNAHDYCFGYGRIKVRTGNDIYFRIIPEFFPSSLGKIRALRKHPDTYISGNELLKNWKLNLYLAAAYTKWLDLHTATQENSILAYQSGLEGHKRGDRRMGYIEGVMQRVKDWRTFKKKNWFRRSLLSGKD